MSERLQIHEPKRLWEPELTACQMPRSEFLAADTS